MLFQNNISAGHTSLLQVYKCYLITSFASASASAAINTSFTVFLLFPRKMKGVYFLLILLQLSTLWLDKTHAEPLTDESGDKTVREYQRKRDASDDYLTLQPNKWRARWNSGKREASDGPRAPPVSFRGRWFPGKRDESEDQPIPPSAGKNPNWRPGLGDEPDKVVLPELKFEE